MPSETAFYYKEFLIVLGVAGLAVPLFLRVGVNAVLAFLDRGRAAEPGHPRQPRALRARPVIAQHFRSRKPRPHRRSRRRLPAVPDRHRAVLRAPQHHAPPGLRARRAAGGAEPRRRRRRRALALGFDMRAALVAGAALSLSSTAIVVQLLSDSEAAGLADRAAQLRHPADAGSGRHPLPAAAAHPRPADARATSWSACCSRCCRPAPRSPSSSASAASCCARCCGWWRAPAVPTCSWPPPC